MNTLSYNFNQIFKCGGLALSLTAAILVPSLANATTADGTAYISYDLAAWSTLASPGANANGQRFLYPIEFANQTKGAINFPADFANPSHVPATQPSGGFAAPVNTYGTNSFTASPSYAITSYDSATNPTGLIGLGGSIRSTSDVSFPNGSIWWERLALQKGADNVWRLLATGDDNGAGSTGSIFELISPTITDVGGKLSLSADYKFGNTDWAQAFNGGFGNYNIDTNKVLGHINLVPSTVPVPAAVWLFGTALLGLSGYRRRTSFLA